jgi:hypothetical protein
VRGEQLAREFEEREILKLWTKQSNAPQGPSGVHRPVTICICLDQQLSHAVKVGWGSMDYSIYLMTVVNLFAWKFRWTGLTELLNNAIDLTRQVVSTCYCGLNSRADWQSNLNTLLHWRYQLKGDTCDLDEAISHARVAARGISHMRPGQSALMNNFTDLMARGCQDTDHEAEAWNPSACHLEVWACHSAPPRTRLRAALKAADPSIYLNNWIT